MSETTTAPAFRVTADFWKSLPPMPPDDFPGAEGFIADVYPNPDGSARAVGYSELGRWRSTSACGRSRRRGRR
ncbi:hypothetical protein LCL87_08875 [Rhodococcus hoagii]|nr:hypothetical protein [Prescottella equi]